MKKFLALIFMAIVMVSCSIMILYGVNKLRDTIKNSNEVVIVYAENPNVEKENNPALEL